MRSLRLNLLKSHKGIEMTYEFIEYDASDGIGRVFLARPEKLNALSRELQAELVECMQMLDDDPDIRVMT